MKNRILWIFEEGENAATPQNQAAAFNASNENPAFVAFPWALFAGVDERERATMLKVYQAAYQRTVAEFSQRDEERQRFERLLQDLDERDAGEEY